MLQANHFIFQCTRFKQAMKRGAGTGAQGRNYWMMIIIIRLRPQSDKCTNFVRIFATEVYT